MYVEMKPDGDLAWARVGRTAVSKSGRTMYFDGRTLRRARPGTLVCYGEEELRWVAPTAKVNYVDCASGELFWISAPRRDGTDRLEAGLVEVDADVRAEYWTQIRRSPELRETARFRSIGSRPRRTAQRAMGRAPRK